MEGHPFIRLFVLAMLAGIVLALGSAFRSLFRNKGTDNSTVKALTIRVGLSIALFLILMLLAATGVIKPH